MNKLRYMAMKDWFLSHNTAFRILKIAYSLLPAAMFILYPLMVIVKAVMGFDTELLKMVCVPAGVLLFVTVMRKLINRTRPYDKYGTAPLLKKDDNHSSMPSRHTASAFIIAMSGFVLWVPLGIALLCIAAIIALTRILAGVHYISDVICGMALSVAVGVIFFVIL